MRAQAASGTRARRSFRRDPPCRARSLEKKREAADESAERIERVHSTVEDDRIFEYCRHVSRVALRAYALSSTYVIGVSLSERVTREKGRRAREEHRQVEEDDDDEKKGARKSGRRSVLVDEDTFRGHQRMC